MEERARNMIKLGITSLTLGVIMLIVFAEAMKNNNLMLASIITVTNVLVFIIAVIASIKYMKEK